MMEEHPQIMVIITKDGEPVMHLEIEGDMFGYEYVDRLNECWVDFLANEVEIAYFGKGG
jgi:hypothetical protein